MPRRDKSMGARLQFFTHRRIQQRFPASPFPHAPPLGRAVARICPLISFPTEISPVASRPRPHALCVNAAVTAAQFEDRPFPLGCGGSREFREGTAVSRGACSLCASCGAADGVLRINGRKGTYEGGATRMHMPTQASRAVRDTCLICAGALQHTTRVRGPR